MKNLNDCLHNDHIRLNNDQQREIFKVFTIVTLRQLLVRLSESIHSAEGKDGQYLSMSIVVNSVVKVIEQHIKSLDSTNHERGKSTRTVTEFLTEFLANLAEDNDVLQK